LPYVAIAFRSPAYSDVTKDKAALDLLAPIAFGENSDLYQRLVLKEQKVDAFDVSFANRADPELFTIFARIKDAKNIDYVRDQILATFKRYTTESVAQAKLDATRSRLRYGFALAMDSRRHCKRARRIHCPAPHAGDAQQTLCALRSSHSRRHARRRLALLH
jgi:zinc protease